MSLTPPIASGGEVANGTIDADVPEIDPEHNYLNEISDNVFGANSVHPVQPIPMDVDDPLVDLHGITKEHGDLGNNFPFSPAYQGNSVESTIEVSVANFTVAMQR